MLRVKLIIKNFRDVIYKWIFVLTCNIFIFIVWNIRNNKWKEVEESKGVCRKNKIVLNFL